LPRRTGAGHLEYLDTADGWEAVIAAPTTLDDIVEVRQALELVAELPERQRDDLALLRRRLQLPRDRRADRRADAHQHQQAARQGPGAPAARTPARERGGQLALAVLFISEMSQLCIDVGRLSAAERRDLANALLRAAWSAVLEETRILLLDLLVEVDEALLGEAA
jgi:hypothetical protein